MMNSKSNKNEILAELIAFEGRIEELGAKMRAKCLISHTLDSVSYFDHINSIIKEHKNKIAELQKNQIINRDYLQISKKIVTLQQQDI